MKQLLMLLIQAFLALLTPELLKKFADMVLDFAEDYVTGTASDIDDALVLPLCETIRKVFDIPDDDEEEPDA